MNNKPLQFKEIYAEVRESFLRKGPYSTSISEKIGDIFAYYMTPAFLNAGLSANKTTALSLFICFLAACFTIIPGGWTTGLLIYALAVVLDHVDGRIARATNTQSYFGLFWDALVDALKTSIMRAAFVWVIYVQTSFSPLFWVSFTCLMLTPFYVFLHDRYSSFTRCINEQKGTQLKPYIRHDVLLKPASVIEEIDRLSLLFSIVWFGPALWIYFTLNLILQLFFIGQHLYSAFKNMRVYYAREDLKTA